MTPTLRNRALPPQRVPWWGRLEVRVIAALVLLGILCVGASAYLVQLSVSYFDTRLTHALEDGEEIAAAVEPFHHELIEAKIEAYEARGRAMGLELAVGDAEGVAAPDEERVREIFEREADLVAVVLERADGSSVHFDREETYPEAEFDWFDVTADVAAPGDRAAGRLRVVFRIDPEIDARWQALGELKRQIGAEQDTQQEIEDAVIDVVGLASALVLIVSALAGFLVARTMTQKASELSRVMRRVGQGDLSARAERLGRDELGQLARAFNNMLDELKRAQERVAYLQRIGAWQEMARRIAHEIKNPLTPIQLSVQQLREKDPGLSPDFTRLLDTSCEIVEDEVASLRRMVTSFSQFAKVPEVKLEEVALGRVLTEFERAYGHLSEEDEDTLHVEPPGETILIEGDRQLLKQSLINLVENAVLSAREAGRRPVRVEIGCDVADEEVRLWVDDNGPGVPASRKEEVFEPYETTRSQGTGLGLAIVKKIILDHGGEVWVEDSPLGGARFVISLPRSS